MLLEEPQIRRWAKEEYHQAAELGWFDRQRVEFLDGEVIEKAPQRDAHAYALRLAASALQQRYGASHTILIQMPLNLGPESEPGPDGAVVKGALRDVRQHPTGAELVVEISDTTLGFDRSRKATLYGRHRIGEYWIVNLVDRQIEVYRRGSVDRFDPPQIYRAGPIASSILPGPAIDVADLLPD
ncbi:MAG: Uma2 family endonuclease [Tepidisphaeraceae bacterium]